jgi:hypothetical protein
MSETTGVYGHTVHFLEYLPKWLYAPGLPVPNSRLDQSYVQIFLCFSINDLVFKPLVFSCSLYSGNLNTVIIPNQDDSGIQMVDLCPEVEWSGF